MQIQADKLRLAEQEMVQWRDKAEKLEAEAASWYEQDEGYAIAVWFLHSSQRY